MVSTIIITLASLFGATLFVLLNTRLYWSKIPLPPGPKYYSFIKGNKFSPKVWRQFLKLRKQYGDLYTVWIGPTPYVICASVKVAKDILEVHSAETIERPNIQVPMRMTGEMKVSTMHANELWRKARILIHQSTTGEKAVSYQPIQAKYSRILAMDLLKYPDEYPDAIRKFAASVVIRIAFGKEPPKTYDDPEIQRVVSVMQKIAMASKPGQWVVDAYPVLRFFPGWMLGNWKKMADEAFQHEITLFRENMKIVADKMAKGEAEPCAMVDCLLEKEKWGMSDDELAYVVGGIFTAGSDTTAVSIINLLLAAVCHPEAQKKAQEEIQKYCGNRPPVWEDREDLAYIEAFVNEATRWRTVMPIGVYHACVEDIHYGEYIIPKGAGVIAPHVCLHRDEEVYPDSEKFLPERWLLPRNTEKDNFVLDPNVAHYTFGFGRRSCVGRVVAERSVFMAAATIFWSFNIKPKVDPKTHKAYPIDPRNYVDALISAPEYFNVDFEPRMPREELEKALEINVAV